MRTLIAIAALVALLAHPLNSFSANPDDAAWLIYDVSYGDYFLLRIDMKTSMTGRANIGGGNRYAGRRFTGQGGWFGVSMLSGNMSINKTGAEPFMVGIINARGDEYSGEFLKEDGSSAGRFVGALQGFTTHQMDLFQLCKEDKSDDFRCVNRGRDQRCEFGAYRSKSTFFTEKNCLAEIGDVGFQATKPETQETCTASFGFPQDVTGTWLLRDERKGDYVLARLVSDLNTEGASETGEVQGTYVFSGEEHYFGRRELGSYKVWGKVTHGTFTLTKSGAINFIHDASGIGKDQIIYGQLCSDGKRMSGDFKAQEPGVESFGDGRWTGEKKSDDPDHPFALYQYCRDEVQWSDLGGLDRMRMGGHPHDQSCKNVGVIRSNDTNRPKCDVGYTKGPITFLEKESCLNLMKSQCRLHGGDRPLPGGHCVENGWHPKK